MKKRILSCLLVCVLCLTLLPMAALADEGPATVEEAVAVEEAAAVEELAPVEEAEAIPEEIRPEEPVQIEEEPAAEEEQPAQADEPAPLAAEVAPSLDGTEPDPALIPVISAENSFRLQYSGNSSAAYLSLIIEKDNGYYDFDSDYTDIQYESEGFVILSRESVSTGENLTVRLSPDYPAGQIAVLTIWIMDGSEVKKTLSFFGLNSDKGSWVDTSTRFPWVKYYIACKNAGEITSEEYDQILDIINSAPEPLLKDPRQSLEDITIYRHPESVPAAEAGTRVGFFIGATGVGLTYQWQYYNTYTKQWVDIAGATNSYLEFTIKLSYNGIYYRCIAKNSSGKSVTSNYAKLTVTSGIHITAQPQDVTVEAGQRAVFSVVAWERDVSYQWQCYNAYYKKWIDLTGATYPTMYFTAKSSYSGIYYRCVITLGSDDWVISNYVKLTVTASDPPVITAQPHDLTTGYGDWAVFTVVAEGDGLSYQWQYYSTYYKAWLNISGAAYATMRFITQDSYNGIYYRCVIMDSVGASVASNSVKLTVTAGEPMPEEENCPEFLRFYLQYATKYDGELIPLSLIRAQDSEWYHYHADYTEVLVEADGLEILSQKTVSSGEDYVLGFSADLSEGHMASITFRVMNGDTMRIEYTLYALKTDMGTYVSSSAATIWNNYYYNRYKAGEFTDSEWFLMYPVIMNPSLHGVEASSLEDPWLAYQKANG